MWNSFVSGCFILLWRLMKCVTYPIASTWVAVTGCNVTPAQDGYTKSVQDWADKLQCSAKSTYAFFANNGFFSIKSQRVNVHVCINQGITTTSMNLMLNAQHSLSGMNSALRACFCFNAVYVNCIWVFCIGSFAFNCNNVYLYAIFYLAVECCVHLPRSSNVLISTVCAAAYLLCRPVRN